MDKDDDEDTFHNTWQRWIDKVPETDYDTKDKTATTIKKFLDFWWAEHSGPKLKDKFNAEGFPEFVTGHP